MKTEMEQKYRVLANIDGVKYLDGFDGEEYEWTENKKVAWLMSLEQALKKVKALHRVNIFAAAERV